MTQVVAVAKSTPKARLTAMAHRIRGHQQLLKDCVSLFCTKVDDIFRWDTCSESYGSTVFPPILKSKACRR